MSVYKKSFRGDFQTALKALDFIIKTSSGNIMALDSHAFEIDSPPCVYRIYERNYFSNLHISLLLVAQGQGLSLSIASIDSIKASFGVGGFFKSVVKSIEKYDWASVGIDWS